MKSQERDDTHQISINPQSQEAASECECERRSSGQKPGTHAIPWGCLPPSVPTSSFRTAMTFLSPHAGRTAWRTSSSRSFNRLIISSPETLLTDFTVYKRNLATETPPRPQLSTSIILNRAPILTPKPSSFASSYHAYQYRLSRALSTPFPQHFYFKKGTTLQQRFHNEELDRDRETLGVGFGKGARLRLPPESYDKPLPRVNEADRTGDVRSLDRSGDRNLYLLVKRSEWKLPQAPAAPGEALHVVSSVILRHIHVL